VGREDLVKILDKIGKWLLSALMTRFDLIERARFVASNFGSEVAVSVKMILTIAVLLLQIPAIPQDSISRVSRALAEVTPAAVSEASAKPDTSALAVSSDRTEAANPPPTSKFRVSEELPPVSDASSAEASAAPASLSEPVSVSKFRLQDRSEKVRRREWLALTIAQHSAAAFDAWSTRQALSSGEAHELNPIFRPFAGNASLYAAIQVGPVLLDYLSRRMMTSQYGWARHTWWILQAVSTATSLASGAHNLSIH